MHQLAEVIVNICWTSVSDATSYRYCTVEIGALAVGTYQPGFPIKIMTYDPHNLSAAAPEVFGTIVDIVEKALSDKYVLIDSKSVNIDPRVYMIALRLPNDEQLDVYLHSESNEIKYTDMFVEHTTDEFPDALEFIVLVKSWAVEAGIMSFDYHHDGRIPETVFDILASSIIRSTDGEPDFELFFQTLLELAPDESKRTFIPDTACFGSRTAEDDDFIHVSYPYYMCGNAAAGVCPNFWKTKVVPAVLRARVSVSGDRRESAILLAARVALLGK
jgi:hypothetical protein